MAFKNEERGSGFISGPAIMKKACDERFENLINEVRGLSAQERDNAGHNTFVQLLENFHKIWDESPQAWIEPTIMFLRIATWIGMAGMPEGSAAKRKEVIGYVSAMKELGDAMSMDPQLFDCTCFGDDEYEMMITVFLSASLQPLTSPYPNILFTYMLLVAFADKENTKAVEFIRHLREEYIAYALIRSENDTYELKINYDRGLFAAKQTNTPASKPAVQKAEPAPAAPKPEPSADEIARELKHDCDQCLFDFRKKQGDIHSQRKAALDEVFKTFSGASASEIRTIRSRFKSANDSAGRSLEKAIEQLNYTANKLLERGAGYEFISRVKSTIYLAVSELSSLQVNVDFGEYGGNAIEYRPSTYVTGLSDQWMKRYEEHPETIGEKKRSAVRQLKAEIARLEKEISKNQQTAEQTREEFEKSDKTIWERVKNATAETEPVVQTCEKAYQEAETALKTTNEKLLRAKAELESTFFLAFGKKSQLKEQIAALDKEVKAADIAVKKCKREKENAEYEYEKAKRTVLDPHNNLRKNLEKSLQAAEKAQKNLDAAREKLQKAEEELENWEKGRK